MHRDTDGAGLIRDGAGNGLTDPPCGIGRELVAALILELVHGLHQADVAFLNQVEELQAAVRVLFGDADHKAQVRADELLFGAHGGVVAALDAPEHFLKIAHIVAAFFLKALEDFDLPKDHFLVGEQLVHAHVQFLGGEHGADVAGIELAEQVLDFFLILARGQEVRRQVALTVAHLADVVFHRLDDPVDERLFQLDVAQTRDDFFLERHDFLLNGGHAALQRTAFVQLGVDFAFFLECLADFLQQQDNAGALVHLVFSRVVFLNGLDHILQFDAVELEVFAHVDEFFHRDRDFHERVQDILLALLDFLGDGNFAVTIEQRHRAHFAQVHTDRVRAAGGKVGGVFVVHQFKAFFGLLSVRFSRGDGDFLAVLFQIHNGDFELIEDPDDLLELLGCIHFQRDSLVHFLEREEAHLLAFGDEALDLLDIFNVVPHESSPTFPEGRANIPNRPQNCLRRLPDAMRPKPRPIARSNATYQAWCGLRRIHPLRCREGARPRCDTGSRNAFPWGQDAAPLHPQGTLQVFAKDPAPTRRSEPDGPQAPEGGAERRDTGPQRS